MAGVSSSYDMIDVLKTVVEYMAREYCISIFSGKTRGGTGLAPSFYTLYLSC